MTSEVSENTSLTSSISDASSTIASAESEVAQDSSLALSEIAVGNLSLASSYASLAQSEVAVAQLAKAQLNQDLTQQTALTQIITAQASSLADLNQTISSALRTASSATAQIQSDAAQLTPESSSAVDATYPDPSQSKALTLHTDSSILDPVAPEKTSEKTLVKTASRALATSTKLPQTGDAENRLPEELGIGLLALAAGLSRRKKKQIN
jgi:LPXTG-motif cell wall-anchored protein